MCSRFERCYSQYLSRFCRSEKHQSEIVRYPISDAQADATSYWTVQLFTASESAAKQTERLRLTKVQGVIASILSAEQPDKAEAYLPIARWRCPRYHTKHTSYYSMPPNRLW